LQVYSLEEILSQEEDPGVDGIPENKFLANVLNTTGTINSNLCCLGHLMVLRRRVINTECFIENLSIQKTLDHLSLNQVVSHTENN